MELTHEQQDNIVKQALEIIKYNQLPDQNGYPHPNAPIFYIIERAFKILATRASLHSMM